MDRHHLGGVPLASLFAAWQMIHAPIPGRGLLAVPILLLGVCLPLSLLFFTTYRINDAALRIRSGFFTWDIPIHTISKVERTNDPVSSPALSLDRIRIEYGAAQSVVISPLRKDDLLRDLQRLGVPGSS
ncbi:MAG: PH domain-containing protein [Deltaproteobacteria bacterium]|nr:PH domain-containing protein [Deltaproteobacteria bacterium]